MSSKGDKKHVDVLMRLQTLGLNSSEARVYTALLPRRDTGTSKIIQATGLHGQVVYDALEKLEQLGLAKHVILNGRKKFSASNPVRLLSLAEEKRMMAQSLARDLQSHYSGVHEQDFEVFQGEHSFIAHELETLRAVPFDTHLDIISGGKDKYWLTMTEAGYADEYEQIRKERNIRFRCISSDTTIQDFKKMNRERWGWSHKVLPGLATGVVDTDIWHDQVHFNMFGDSILSFSLLGKEIADGYREFFETLWKIAK